METNVVKNPQNLMQQIQNTPATHIAQLDFVREKYIQNYNACNKEKVGELMYHRNVVHFMQKIGTDKNLAKAEPFSLYACFVTAAVNGYSLDPQDNEVYLICRDGKACLDRQAGAHIKKLTRTGQIQYCEQAKLVYQGDVFEVENGRVKRHVETFQSDTIIAGYVRMIIDEKGADRFFIYRKSDWESWWTKSPNKKTIEKSYEGRTYLSASLWDGGILGGTQPDPGFLRTKIVKHAASEKCWSSSNIIPVETYAEIEVDTDDEYKEEPIVTTEKPSTQQSALPQQPQQPQQQQQPTNDEFASTIPAQETVTYVDDNF